MVKAGVVAALALTLLVPTFNALNLSYVENVQPPPWIPPPKDPPNITPPTDFEPPPDMTPPTNWQGEVPPGACPPPLIRPVNETNEPFTVVGPQPRWTKTLPFTLPRGVLALEGYANFTSWRAQAVHARLEGPEGFTEWSQDARGPTTGGLLVEPSAQRTSFHYASYQGEEASPVPAGDYVLTLSADYPLDGQGSTTFGVALACGGMMSR